MLSLFDWEWLNHLNKVFRVVEQAGERKEMSHQRNAALHVEQVPGYTQLMGISREQDLGDTAQNAGLSFMDVTIRSPGSEAPTSSPTGQLGQSHQYPRAR